MVKWLRGLELRNFLELIHSDVYEPFYVYTWKMWVFHHFTNEYFSFRYVYRKYHTLYKFFEVKVELDYLLGKHISYFD